MKMAIFQEKRWGGWFDSFY